MDSRKMIFWLQLILANIWIAHAGIKGIILGVIYLVMALISLIIGFKHE